MKIERNIRRIELGSPIRIWTQLIQPKLSLPSNVEEVCKYGFIKALSNIFTNSTSETITIKAYQDNFDTQFELAARSCGSELNTILAKERNYYWSQNHSDKWSFFASKMFDEFSIENSGLVVTFKDDDFFITTSASNVGTSLKMKIKNSSNISPKEIFDQYCSDNY